VREIGLARVGQTADLVPADKKLYALRDVTATVDIIPLIASSIMSKKIAGGADAIVLDVKVGDGAFMKTLDEARDLARTMVELVQLAGREVVCELTDMDQPLGFAVGNALEIREALDTLEGNGPPDLTELVLGASAHLLALSDLGVEAVEGRRLAEDAVASGAARDLYDRWVCPGGPLARGASAGGGRSPVAAPPPASSKDCATGIGLAASAWGGRLHRSTIDHAVGVVCLAKRGDRSSRSGAGGDHARRGRPTARARSKPAIGSETEPEPKPIVLDVLT
jgi:pyrimidine-nucleoside phosphorylase